MKGSHWESNYFDLLGLTFSVNLQEMGNLNFESKIREIKDKINGSPAILFYLEK